MPFELDARKLLGIDTDDLDRRKRLANLNPGSGETSDSCLPWYPETPRCGRIKSPR